MRSFGLFKRRQNKPELQYPIKPAPRVAVFDDRYSGSSSVVIIPDQMVGSLSLHRVETVAASAHVISSISALDWKPSHPMVVFSTPEQRLKDEDREQFWRDFEVPVFEQVIDGTARLLASECEAHFGLHLEVDEDLRLPGTELTRDLCGCGRSGARFVPEFQGRAQAD